VFCTARGCYNDVLRQRQRQISVDLKQDWRGVAASETRAGAEFIVSGCQQTDRHALGVKAERTASHQTVNAPTGRRRGTDDNGYVLPTGQANAVTCVPASANVCVNFSSMPLPTGARHIDTVLSTVHQREREQSFQRSSQEDDIQRSSLALGPFLPAVPLSLSLIGCLHDPANVQH